MSSAALFPLGQMLGTPAALKALSEVGENAGSYFLRHVSGDWGDMCDEDKELNNEALKDGERLLSAYTLSSGVRIWVITEWDRSVTTCLLPEEN